MDSGPVWVSLRGDEAKVVVRSFEHHFFSHIALPPHTHKEIVIDVKNSPSPHSKNHDR